MPNSQQQTPYAQLLASIRDVVQRLAPILEGDNKTTQGETPETTLPTIDTTDAPSGTAPSETAPSARLEHLCQRLGLTIAERDILLLCVGVELEPIIGERCAQVNGDERVTHVTPKIIITAFGEAGIQVLDPNSSLRKWQVISLQPGMLSLCQVRIDRTILHFLMGHSYEDPLFTGRLRLVETPSVEPLPDSYKAVVTQVTGYWQAHQQQQAVPMQTPIQLCGQDISTQQLIAGLLLPGTLLYSLSALSLPTEANELYTFCLRWKRQALIGSCVLLLDCYEIKANDGDRIMAITQLLETAITPIVLLSMERLPLSNAPFTIDIPSLAPLEQKALWQAELKDYAEIASPAFKHELSQIVAQFNLPASAIAHISQKSLSQQQIAAAPTPKERIKSLSGFLWENCRSQSRTQLEGFAKRVEPKTTWDDLILSQGIVDSLKQIVAQVRQRSTVYDEWEMGGRSRRGLGITAMFHGISGTGKTTAAELIANELNLDLYHVDLSAIVSKYIGETEKNLAKIFAAAETAGAILQFDEADAIIGKRSDVKDARDRYANMEVSYLLQRMEAYPGLAILTTNLPNALDAAFLRRIRFSIAFEFPSYDQRVEMWRRVYQGKSAPLSLDLDPRRLGVLNMTGATIRNVAMGAAFLAADEAADISMAHILQATRAEYRKENRNLTPKDIRMLTGQSRQETRPATEARK
ncbi:MAG: ATP-binding protein [Cyanobacteria bacterium J06598_3]